MTDNRRIVLNILATYGRSLYALLLGVLAGRWTLMALGESDYGLMGVVGGMTSYVMFATWMITGAVGRFYAVSVGKAKANYPVGLEECRKWFTVAVVILTAIPVVIFSIGYPIGVWAIHNFLNIPADRVDMCGWVWICACLSSAMSLVTTPFVAMYRAKQLIAELTVYSLVSATLLFAFQYYMVTHPGVWLVKLSAFSCFLTITPNLIISARARALFPECRFRFNLFSLSAVRQLFSFSIWYLFSAVCSLLKGQTVTLLVNKYFGLSVNAAFSVCSSVSSHTNSLSASLMTAFSPAVMNAYGADDEKKAIDLAERMSKFGAALVLLFVLPLCLEISEVMLLWLKKPPKYAMGLCVIVLVRTVCGKLTGGYNSLVSATGKVAAYNLAYGTAMALAFPIAWVFVAIGGSVYWVAVASFVAEVLVGACRLFFARKHAGISVRRWSRKIFLPIVLLALVCLLAGLVPRFTMAQSFLRLVMTSMMTTLMFGLAGCCIVLDRDERQFVWQRIVKPRFVSRRV